VIVMVRSLAQKTRGVACFFLDPSLRDW
jgi:hypothetical protein